MSQLLKLKKLLGNPNDEDEILQFYLDTASDIICEIRNSDKVEKKYLNTQIEIAIELYNKRGAEGQSSHRESGISRVYSKAHVSPELLSKITPMMRSPFSGVRVVE